MLLCIYHYTSWYSCFFLKPFFCWQNVNIGCENLSSANVFLWTALRWYYRYLIFCVQNVKIENFTTTLVDGLAFCAPSSVTYLPASNLLSWYYCYDAISFSVCAESEDWKLHDYLGRWMVSPSLLHLALSTYRSLIHCVDIIAFSFSVCRMWRLRTSRLPGRMVWPSVLHLVLPTYRPLIHCDDITAISFFCVQNMKLRTSRLPGLIDGLAFCSI
jgi:hypothetical protein